MIIDVLYRKLQTELSDYEIDSAIAIYDIAKEYSFSYISVKEWQYINTSGLTRARTREEQDKLQKLMSAIGRGIWRQHISYSKLPKTVELWSEERLEDEVMKYIRDVAYQEYGAHDISTQTMCTSIEHSPVSPQKSMHGNFHRTRRVYIQADEMN